VRTKASLAHPRRNLAINRYRYFEEFGTEGELRTSGGVEIHGESNVIVDSEELNHSAVLNEIRGVADGQDSLTVEGFEIGCDASAFGRTDVSNRTRAGLGSGFEAYDANLFTIERFIRSEVIERMSEGIVADDADIESLAIVDRIGGREPDEFSEIEEVGRLDGIFGQPDLGVGECGKQADSDNRRRAFYVGDTIRQGPPQGRDVGGAGIGRIGDHLWGVLLIGPGIEGLKIFGAAEGRDIRRSRVNDRFPQYSLAPRVAALKSGGYLGGEI
jgi:hypothetical protein